MTGLAVRALARQLARRYVVADIHRAGQKFRSYRLDEISRMASDYVVAHPELIVLAQAMADAIRQRQLARRELLRQRRLAAKQCSHSAEIPNTPPSPASTASKETING
jgi:hypothetical protein